jgi:hypothetical protein
VNEEERREQRLKLQDDHIGRALAVCAASGAPSYGKPLHFGDETPPALRMAMKVLKDAGVVPPEVEAMQQIAALQAELDALAPDDAAGDGLRRRIADKRQALALRLETLRLSGTL